MNPLIIILIENSPTVSESIEYKEIVYNQTIIHLYNII